MAREQVELLCPEQMLLFHRRLAEHRRVRIIVYRNGKCTEPVEVVADLSNLEEVSKNNKQGYSLNSP